MNGKIEGEGKEGQDDEIDQADCDCWRHDSRSKGAEVELGEANSGIQRLRDALEVFSWDGGILPDHAGPHLAKLGSHLCFEGGELRKDIIQMSRFVSGFDVDDLASSKRIVGSVCLINGLPEHRGRVWHDDDGGVCFPIKDGLPDKQRIVVKDCRIHCFVSQMRIGSRKHHLGSLRDHGSHKWSSTGERRHPAVEILASVNPA